MSNTLARLNFWYGQVFGTEEGEALWDAVEVARKRLGDLLTPATKPILISEPTLVLDDGDVEVDVGPFAGWSGQEPMFQLGTISVPYGTATQGAQAGATLPASGASRTVVLCARYTTIDAVPIVDVGSVPGYQERHHGVAWRVVQSAVGATGAGVSEPADLAAEVEGGSVPVAVIYRDDDGGGVVDTLYACYNAWAPVAVDGIERGAALPPGCFEAGEGDSKTLLPTLSSVDLGSSDWRVRLAADQVWWANVGGAFLKSGMLDDTLDAVRLTSPPIGFVGTSVVRLAAGGADGAWPRRPYLYVADGTNYPAADGDAYDAVPAGLQGVAESEGGTNGVFPGTVNDLVIGIVSWDGSTQPVLTPLANPAQASFTVEVAADYASSPTLTANLTPPLKCGRPWVLSSVEWGTVNEGSAPVNRGHHHNLKARITYQTPALVQVELKGEWFDTSSGLATAVSSRYFRPPARLTFTLAPPAINAG